MGHAHAAFLLLQINLRAVLAAWQSSANLSVRAMRVKILNLAADRRTRVQLDSGEYGIYIHLDDFLFMGGDPPMVTQLWDAVVAELHALGFDTTGGPLPDGERYIGFCFDSRRCRWTPTADRLGTLDRCIEEVLLARVVDVTVVHTLLCVYTWAALLWRPALSVPHSIYVFVRQSRRWCPLWPSVRWELEVMRGMLGLLAAELSRPVAPVVLAQDASVQGSRPYGKDLKQFGAYCLAAATPPAHEVTAALAEIETIGRRSLVPYELGYHSARLGLAPEISLLPRAHLPLCWFTGAVNWHMLFSRRWLRALNIGEGELRCCVRWASVAARVPALHGLEVLSPSDNRGCVGLIARGRTSTYYINRHLRRLAAVEGAFNMRFKVPWLDTGHQPADGGTREDSRGNLATGLVQWVRRVMFIEVGIRGGFIRVQVSRMGVECVDDWAIGQKRTCGLLRRAGVRRLLRLLESGLVHVMWWWQPGRCYEHLRHGDADDMIEVSYDRYHEVVLTCVNILSHYDGAFGIVEHVKHSFWDHPSIAVIIRQYCRVDVQLDLCRFSAAHLRLRAVGNLPNLETLACRCRGRCGSHFLRLAKAASAGRSVADVECGTLGDVVAPMVVAAIRDRDGLVGHA